MNLKNNFPCICGHSKRDHLYQTGICNFSNIALRGNLICKCLKFKPNNLRYLEQKSQEVR